MTEKEEAEFLLIYSSVKYKTKKAFSISMTTEEIDFCVDEAKARVLHKILATGEPKGGRLHMYFLSAARRECLDFIRDRKNKHETLPLFDAEGVPQKESENEIDYSSFDELFKRLNSQEAMVFRYMLNCAKEKEKMSLKKMTDELNLTCSITKKLVASIRSKITIDEVLSII